MCVSKNNANINNNCVKCGKIIVWNVNLIYNVFTNVYIIYQTDYGYITHIFTHTTFIYTHIYSLDM